jgi:hypothetical protein
MKIKLTNDERIEIVVALELLYDIIVEHGDVEAEERIPIINNLIDRLR